MPFVLNATSANWIIRNRRTKQKILYIDPTIYCKSYTPVRRYLILPCLQKMQFLNTNHEDVAFCETSSRTLATFSKCVFCQCTIRGSKTGPTNGYNVLLVTAFELHNCMQNADQRNLWLLSFLSTYIPYCRVLQDNEFQVLNFNGMTTTWNILYNDILYAEYIHIWNTCIFQIGLDALCSRKRLFPILVPVKTGHLSPVLRIKLITMN